MSIRGKIVLFALAIALCEAVLIGVIGYNGVASVSRNAEELRRVGWAIEGVRSLNVDLTGLADPEDAMGAGARPDADRFGQMMDSLNRQVLSCAATSCHGYAKRPPAMAASMLHDLAAIRAAGLRLLTASAVEVREWASQVGGPARRMSRMTEEMSRTLMAHVRETESAGRDSEQRALFLVGSVTLLCVLAAVALCSPVARGMTRPLEELEEQTRAIARGELGSHASEDGPREIRELARSFNRMQDDLARKRDELLGHQGRLEREVEARVAELRRADDLLKRSEKLAGIGLVAGAVAHDLNNPLTNILLNAERLAQTRATGADAGVIADEILKHAERCRQIVGDIRALAREGEVELVSCNVPDLVHEAVRLLRYKWEPKAVRVAVSSDLAVPGCACSPPRITQAFVNLIDNAIDASYSGGEVRVRVGPREGRLVVEIQDHGPGVPRRARVSLFRALFTTKPDGTGLGLAVARRIVEQHDGRIDFTTCDREDAAAAGLGATTGTTVTVSLPPQSPNGGAAAPAPLTARPGAATAPSPLEP
ncbi:MAG: HAMP domain-containing histidine kinase [Planctomycetes bacterium]|nr:HAMP domain-containing histidine kinase [Planctomycetota bacterium]